MNIERLLRISGIGLVVIGLLAGTFGWSTVDFDSYKTAKEVYNKLSTNEVAEASYNAAKNIFMSEISLVIASAIGSIIGGFILIGLAKMIENQTEILSIYKQRKPLPVTIENEKMHSTTFSKPEQNTFNPEHDILKDKEINKKEPIQQVSERVLNEIERFYSDNGVVVQYIKATSNDDVYQVKTVNGDEFVELKTGFLPKVMSK